MIYTVTFWLRSVLAYGLIFSGLSVAWTFHWLAHWLDPEIGPPRWSRMNTKIDLNPGPRCGNGDGHPIDTHLMPRWRSDYIGKNGLQTSIAALILSH